MGKGVSPLGELLESCQHYHRKQDALQLISQAPGFRKPGSHGNKLTFHKWHSVDVAE